MRKRLGGIVGLAAVVLFAAGPLPAHAGGSATYAGTVRSIDSAGGSFVLEDVGPWLGGKPANIMPRRIVLTPSTTFAMASRTWSDTSKFLGDYEEVIAQRADLKEGSFVAVECQSAGEGCRATRLIVVRGG